MIKFLYTVNFYTTHLVKVLLLPDLDSHYMGLLQEKLQQFEYMQGNNNRSESRPLVQLMKADLTEQLKRWGLNE